jgi:hypothetical protein
MSAAKGEHNKRLNPTPNKRACYHQSLMGAGYPRR